MPGNHYKQQWNKENQEIVMRIRKIITMAAMTLVAIGAEGQDKTRQERLVDHVYYFASDSLKGRKAGSSEAAMAAEYIRDQYAGIGLKPYFNGWYMPFNRDENDYKNVVGVIEGSDPVLKHEYIVLGAHYDHLGVKKGEIYNGADDNASGTAALIEIARSLMADRQSLKRSVIIAAFDAEEVGLYGSYALADTLNKTGVNVRLMMSIDMVGWLREGKTLKMEGVSTIRNGKRILEDRASAIQIDIAPKNFEKSIMTATDTEGFAELGIPTLAVSTGLKSPYHKPEDDAELIDYEGLEKVSEYIGDVAREFASNSDFGPSGRLSFKHRQRRNAGIDIGPVIGFESDLLRYKGTRFSMDGRNGVMAGADARIHLGGISVHTQGTIGQENYFLLDDNDIFGKGTKLSQTVVKIPAELVFGLSRSKAARSGIGIGAYWSEVLSERISGSCSYDTQKNPWGLSASYTARLYNLTMGIRYDWQMNEFFASEGAPKAAKRNFAFQLGWRF